MSMKNSETSSNELQAHYSFVCGCVAEAAGNERSAMAYYRGEIRRTGYFKAHFNLARLLSMRDRIDEAVEHYNKAVVRSADKISKADSLNNLGIMYLIKDRTAQALECFRKASRLDDKSAAPRVNAALTYVRRGDLRPGREWLQRAERLRRVDPDTDLWIAYTLIEYGLNVRKGVHLLERFAKKKQVERSALLDLAVGYFRLGDKQRAGAVLKRLTAVSSLSVNERRRIRQVQAGRGTSSVARSERLYGRSGERRPVTSS
jgi:tetratricopeptide (TPR) repeat protein